MTTPTTITSEIQKLEPSAIVELFELDLTDLDGDIYYFHAGTNGLRANITWQGQVYTRYPIEAEGFEYNGNGQLPRPKIRVSNLLGSITSILLVYNDLLGGKLTRKRTLKKYLDAVNFTGGVNPDEDTTAEFIDDVYYIDRKSNENKSLVEFELSASIDLVGVNLPRRQIVQNVCSWAYRGTECGYTGAPVFNVRDEVVASATSVEGQAVLAAYLAMIVAKDAYEAAEVELATASQYKDFICDYQYVESQYVNPSTALSTMTYGVFSYGNPDTYYAEWNNVRVYLGSTYRMGSKVGVATGVPNYSYKNLHRIDRWAIDTAGCSTATTDLSTATATRDSALSTYQTAQATLAAAVVALPSDDPLYLAEKCGKRVRSCQLRFGDQEELPFGGFPAAGLIR